MTTDAAIGVDDDLAPGKPRIGRGAAFDETPCRVDENPRIALQPWPHHRHDDLFQHAAQQLLAFDLARMLGRDHDADQPFRPALLIMGECHLCLAIRPQPGETATLAHLCQPAGQLVGKIDRGRHQAFGFIAGVTVENSLVSGAEIRLADHTLCDIGRLLMQIHEDETPIRIEAQLGIDIADTPDHIARNAGHINRSPRRHLACDMNGVARNQNFGRHARHRILRKMGVENGVRNLVANLVGMTFRHRFCRRVARDHDRLLYPGPGCASRVIVFWVQPPMTQLKPSPSTAALNGVMSSGLRLGASAIGYGRPSSSYLFSP
ncbi:hypothetical protein D3C73_941290 [compost metagenome]